MQLQTLLQLLLAPARSNAEAKAFVDYYVQKLWNDFHDTRMKEIKEHEKESPWECQLPPASEDASYEATIALPSLRGQYQRKLNKLTIYLNDEDVTKRLGLNLQITEAGTSFSITGTPTLESFRTGETIAPSTFILHIEYSYTDFGITLSKDVEFAVIQDARKLWRDIDVQWDNISEPNYKTPNEDTDWVPASSQAGITSTKSIVAASKRGRSHAHEGKPRDDNFLVKYFPETGWYVLAVADGAGSAPYSRKGSQLACETTMQYCTEALRDTDELEKAIDQYAYVSREKKEDESLRAELKIVGDKLYNILAIAALKAQKAIFSEAEQQGLPAKQYATTLLLSICKKLNYGWAIASFWIGDGAIALYTQEEKGSKVKILGTPDEGEFGGQTRFLTMPEIFSDSTSLYQRLGFSLVNDFTALFLMSDGVSDPKFETDDNLNNPTKWDELWDELLENDVQLTDHTTPSDQKLLQWLNFWSKGNHDDRTIAILYGGIPEKKNNSIDSDSQEGINKSFTLKDLSEETLPIPVNGEVATLCITENETNIE